MNKRGEGLGEEEREVKGKNETVIKREKKEA